MPSYRVLVFDTKSGDVYDELPYEDFNLSVTVDWGRIDSLSVDVPILGSANQSRDRIISLTARPWATSACLLRNGQALWAGPLTGNSWDQTGLSFSFTGISKLLDKRFLFKSDTDALTVNQDARDAIATLLEQAIIHWTDDGDANYQLPIESITYLGGTPAIDRTWSGVDLVSVYESVKKVTEEEGAPDIRLDAMIDSDQTSVWWEPRFGDPFLGEVEPTVTWNFPANVKSITGTNDGSAMTVRGYSLGDGEDSSRIVMSGTNDLADQGYPWMDITDRAAVSSKNPIEIQARADSLARENGTEAASWDVEVSDRFPGLEGWTVGDNGLFRVSDHGAIKTGEYVRRVTGYSLTSNSLKLETLERISQ